MVLRLARLKAHTCAASLARGGEPLLVLGADTTVVCDGHILNKPANAADAERMLRMLSGRSHQVKTGVCLLSLASPRPNGLAEAAEVVTTEVHFDAIPVPEIVAYAASQEPRDKAGAYAIQGVASRWVRGINGCYFNVVGLPVSAVARMMLRLGYVPVG